MQRPIRSAIEPLESRIAPAVFTVTNLNDSGFGSLRQALADADAHAGADSIAFHLPAPPLHGENIITLASGLTTKGGVTITGPGSGKLIVDAAGTDRVLLITDGNSALNSPATISGLSLIDGQSAGAGAGIFSYESLTLKNVVISTCVAAAGGGGVAVGPVPSAHVKVSISNSTIAHNIAAGSGGGLALYGFDALTLTNSLVTANTSSAGAGGGGVYMDLGSSGTSISVTGCTISGNKADHGAGAIINSYSTNPKAKITVSGSVISGNIGTNSTTHGGGGLYIAKGNVAITSSSIIGNYSAYNGGGIAGEHCAVTISKSVISGNRAASAGGGFALYNLLSLGMTGSSILSNLSGSATLGGGGGYAQIDNTGGIAITGCLVAGNDGGLGGGLFLKSSLSDPSAKITLTGDRISGNLSRGTGVTGGGGLFIAKGNTLITGSTISGNISNSYNGGGIEAVAFNSLAVSKSTISGNQNLQTDNTLGPGGGGIYVAGNSAVPFSKVTIASSTISGNSTSNSGAGVCANAGVDITVSNSVFSSNHAVLDGGAINAGGTGVNSVNVSITGSTFTGNTCLGANDRFGGGLFADGQGTVSIAKSKFTSNVSNDAGGAIYVQAAASFKMSDTILTANTSSFGGGLEIVSVISATVTGGSITGNFAASNGGGILINNSIASIMGTVITGNVASVSGGGVFQTASSVTLQIAKVTANTAHTDPDVSGTFTFV